MVDSEPVKKNPFAGNDRVPQREINILIALWVLGLFSFMFFSARIYFRIKKIHKLLLTDYFLILAVLSQIVVQIFNIIENLVPLKTWADYPHSPLLPSLVAILMSAVAYWALRLSSVLLFLELFPFRTATILIWIAAVVVTVGFVVNMAFVLYCAHFMLDTDLLRHPEIPPDPIRRSIVITQMTSCAIAVLFDISIATLPAIPVWRLNLTKGKKISVSFLFALNWLLVASSIIRLYISAANTSSWPDIKAPYINFTIFGAIEMHLGIMIVSVLTSWRDILRVVKNIWMSPAKSEAARNKRPAQNMNSLLRQVSDWKKKRNDRRNGPDNSWDVTEEKGEPSVHDTGSKVKIESVTSEAKVTDEK